MMLALPLLLRHCKEIKKKKKSKGSLGQIIWKRFGVERVGHELRRGHELRHGDLMEESLVDPGFVV